MVTSLDAAPEFSLEEWPQFIQVQSKKNTPIEGFWRWKRNGEGHSVREALLVGKAEGIFNPSDDLHVYVAAFSVESIVSSCPCSQVFNWLWPPLVQERLDLFREYWNNHMVRHQKKKLLPSGTSPRQLWVAPQSARASARDCSVVVSQDKVCALRAEIGGQDGRAAAFRFVSAEFQAEADLALGELGFPPITLTSAWDVFVLIVDALRTGES